MSYMDWPRLHFAGSFHAGPATVNNVVDNFRPEVRDTMEYHPQWNWNPIGANVWSFPACSVTRLVYADGTVADSAERDCMVGAPFRGTDNPYPAKMADLDPMQQYVPGLFGLELRVGDANEYLEGEFRAISPADMWYRAADSDRSKADPDSAYFQSVLEELKWGATTSGNSRFLRELAGASPRRLAIKFVVEGLEKDRSHPDFLTGRVYGTIGPAGEHEPAHFLGERLLRPPADPSQFEGRPLYFAPFRLDRAAGRLSIDLGNSTTLVHERGAVVDHGELWYVALPHDCEPVRIARSDYREAVLARTAGIQEVPLEPELVQLLSRTPLGLARVDATGRLDAPLLREDPEGRYVRADQFVYRLNPGERASVELRATRFGEPAADEQLRVSLDPETLIDLGLVVDGLPVCDPPGALEYPTTVKTDAAGRASVALEGHDPGRPRFDGAVDGQVYALRYSIGELERPHRQDFLSVRVFDAHPLPAAPTWQHDIRPIFHLYAKLFPYMRELMDLDDYEQVLDNVEMLEAYLSLPITDAGHMPVTRDLSRDKRAMILDWIRRGAPR